MIYAILSALLQYPERELIAALPEIRSALAQNPADTQAALSPLLARLESTPLIGLQEDYVMLFDRNRSHSLHLFEHVYGESRERGPAMVSLMQEYTDRGFGVNADELPDYLPMFLEFLGQINADTARDFLGEAIHVIARIGEKLAAIDSPYAGIFAVLRTLTPVEPLPLAEPPVRDMDEVMEKFGSGFDGSEPLLQPAAGGPQTIQFYPRGHAAQPKGV